MSRYTNIPTEKIKLEDSSPIIYRNVKYPQLPLDPQDVYLYVTQGDRYDILAQDFYDDSNLWWIINLANPLQSPGSLFPTPGSQIRVPAPQQISNILSQYDILNKK
jgi:hypothetical protein